MSLSPIMNNTKWEELRKAMLSQVPTYKWSSKPIDKDFIYGPDGEWFFHFMSGGYKDIEWVEIFAESSERKEHLTNILREIHIPGKIKENSVIVFGYKKPGQAIEWI
jgi:hypothetical protein